MGKPKTIELRDIVVTGVGAITAHGNIEQTVAAMLEGRSAIRSFLPDFPEFALCPTQIGGKIHNFNLCDFGFSKRDAEYILKRMTLPTQFAQVALSEAMSMSGLVRNNPYELGRCGASIGTGIGSSELIAKIAVDMHLLGRGEKELKEFVEEHLSDIIKVLPDASVYQSVKFKGPIDCSVKACATGLGNIRRAAFEMYLGFADMVVAGATESLTPTDVMPFNMYAKKGALSRRNNDPEHASRPFDQGHDGFVPSEGAGIFVLETKEGARRRDAPILAELTGFGESTDGTGHATDPNKEGQIIAMRAAFEWAEIDPRDTLGRILIVAHATSTPAGDGVELCAIKEIFGNNPDVYITAPKSMLGHTLAASGVIQAGTALLAARRGKIFPTINLENPISEALICDRNHAHRLDEACYLNLVPNQAIDAEIDYLLCNAFGFGGQNVCILLKLAKEERG